MFSVLFWDITQAISFLSSSV